MLPSLLKLPNHLKKIYIQVTTYMRIGAKAVLQCQLLPQLRLEAADGVHLRLLLPQTHRLDQAGQLLIC